MAPQSSVLQDINAKTTEQLSLRQDLEVTRQERDDERFAKRSQAGKMSVVTGKLNVATNECNELRAENALMKADAQRSIEHAEIIRAVERIGEQILERVDRPNPLGDPADTLPSHEEWMKQIGIYHRYLEYKANLEENYSKAMPIIRRKDLLATPEFPETAKIRMFMRCLATAFSGSKFDMGNSPSGHRFDLALYSGPIVSEDAFDKIKNSMEILVNHVCPDFVEDDTVYDAIAGDAFLVPEVMLLLLSLLPVSDFKRTQMEKWKLDQRPDVSFSDYFKTAGKKFGYSRETHWRYFTFKHMIGAERHHTKEGNKALLEQFENGEFYLNATVKAMEAKYMALIADVMRGPSEDFKRAAKTAALRASLMRESCQSTRDGKIKNWNSLH